MNSLRRVVIGALWLALAAACAKSKAPQSGTNTNWLKDCSASPDCGGDGDCLCGVCTLPCTSNATCSELGQQATCKALSSATCGGDATGSACLPPSGSSSGSGASGGAGASEGAGASGGADAGLTLTRIGPDVQLTDRWRVCGLDDDCILVGTGCDGCCQQDAIRAHDRDAYEQNFEQVCSDWRGGICDCQPRDLVPLCRDGLCVAVPVEPAQGGCFSPTQNVAIAYQSGAVGCACEKVGLRICVGGKSLACLAGTDGLRWQADEFGACARPVQNCPLSLRSDAAACLDEFETCIERPGGGFCGDGCHGPVDCDRDPCKYVPPTGTECSSRRFTTIWEGTCGDIRYRIQDGLLDYSAAYWNEATGELVARVLGTDTNSYCDSAEFSITRGDFTVVNRCRTVRNDTTLICRTDEDAGAP